MGEGAGDKDDDEDAGKNARKNVLKNARDGQRQGRGQGQEKGRGVKKEARARQQGGGGKAGRGGRGGVGEEWRVMGRAEAGTTVPPQKGQKPRRKIWEVEGKRVRECTFLFECNRVSLTFWRWTLRLRFPIKGGAAHRFWVGWV